MSDWPIINPDYHGNVVFMSLSLCGLRGGHIMLIWSISRDWFHQLTLISLYIKSFCVRVYLGDVQCLISSHTTPGTDSLPWVTLPITHKFLPFVKNVPFAIYLAVYLDTPFNNMSCLSSNGTEICPICLVSPSLLIVMFCCSRCGIMSGRGLTSTWLLRCWWISEHRGWTDRRH